jgi:hypothetical protein
LMHVYNDMCQTSTKQKKRHHCARRNECKEVAVVPPTNAVVEPHTVMIVSFDAVVAHSTMVATRGSPDVAGLAVLDGHFHGGIR